MRITTVKCDVGGCQAQRELPHKHDMSARTYESGWIWVSLENGPLGISLDLCPEHRRAVTDAIGLSAEILSAALGIR